MWYPKGEREDPQKNDVRRRRVVTKDQRERVVYQKNKTRNVHQQEVKRGVNGTGSRILNHK